MHFKWNKIENLRFILFSPFLSALRWKVGKSLVCKMHKKTRKKKEWNSWRSRWFLWLPQHINLSTATEFKWRRKVSAASWMPFVFFFFVHIHSVTQSKCAQFYFLLSRHFVCLFFLIFFCIAFRLWRMFVCRARRESWVTPTFNSRCALVFWLSNEYSFLFAAFLCPTLFDGPASLASIPKPQA